MALGTCAALAQSPSWEQLRTLEHDYSFTVFEKGGQCHDNAVIQEITPSEIVITWNEFVNGQSTIQTKRIGRATVLAVDAGHNIVYSGRSSWRDVRDARPGYGERLRVMTATGNKITGALAAVSDTGLTLSVFGRKHEISRSQIKTIDYLRQRPLSDSGEYIAQEAPGLLLFSPGTWVRVAGVSPKLAVRLYDSSLPQDDSELTCTPARQLKQ
jgi:hypothetical protein